MRAVVQRVQRARVSVADQVCGEIQAGLLVLLGVSVGDTPADVAMMANKILQLRVFEDDQQKMNRSLLDRQRLKLPAGLLVVSQFTILGDCRQGRRPSFIAAAPPEQAETHYLRFVELSRQSGIDVQCGRFRQHMQVELVNDGPVTLLLDSNKEF